MDNTIKAPTWYKHEETCAWNAGYETGRAAGIREAEAKHKAEMAEVRRLIIEIRNEVAAQQGLPAIFQ